MSLDELNIQDYVKSFLNEMNSLYDFKDKTVMFMFYQPDIDNAKAVKCLGASKVYYVNPDESTVSDDEDIICLNSQPEQFTSLESGSVDLIIGLEILEHINNLKQFFSELKRILAENGNIELQGNPMWTSHFGHHLWIENKYIFYDETNPFEPWEHLVYRTKDEYL
ncbi:MAG: methyltransferase domain-containing protein [bacterium]|nr:methyltransferase domain-containing protein [bacterium]